VAEGGARADLLLPNDPDAPSLLQEDSYWVVLTKAPTGNVKVDISADGQVRIVKIDGGAVTPTGSYTLTFTQANWNVAQKVTVKAVNDNALEGTHYSRLTHTVQATSIDNFLGVTTANIADGLAGKVNGDVTSSFDAVVNGNKVTITGPAFTYGFGTPYTVATVTLGGAVALGETWALIVNGTTWSYSVSGTATLDAVAAKLRALINGHDGLSVSGTGNQIILNAGAKLVTVGFQVSAASAGTASISGSRFGYTEVAAESEWAWTVAAIDAGNGGLAPTPAGAVWTLKLDGVEFRYTSKVSNEPLNVIAAGLADAVNQSRTRFAAKYLTATVKLAGTPNTGDVWTLKAGAATATYTVQSGDNLIAVANGLALAVGQLADYGIVTGDLATDTQFAFERDADHGIFTVSLSVAGTNLQSTARISGTTSATASDGRLVVLTSDGTPFTVDVLLAKSASQVDGFLVGGTVASGASTASATHYSKLTLELASTVAGAAPEIIKGAGWDLTLGTRADRYTLDFSGTPRAGEVWTLRLTAGSWIAAATVTASGSSLQAVLNSLRDQINATAGYTSVVATDDGDPATDAARDDGTRLMTIDHLGAFTLTISIKPATGFETAALVAVTDNPATLSYAYVAGSNREVILPDSLDVLVADNDAPGVLVVQTGNSTDVIEPTEIVKLGSGYATQSVTAGFRIGLGLQTVGGVTSAVPAGANQTWTAYLITEAGVATGWNAAHTNLGMPSYTTGAVAPSFGAIAAAIGADIDTRLGSQGFDASYSATGDSDFLSIRNTSNVPFSVFIVVTDSGSTTTRYVLFIGDFGTSTVREVGVHDSVFASQDLDTAKWNTNTGADIYEATTLPHITVLGTGDGNPDFYSFEVTDDMMAKAGADGVKTIFDIDHGYDFRDSILWVGSIRLYSLTTPADPAQPAQPTLVAQSPFINWIPDSGSTYYYDGLLTHFIKQPGKYYVEVTAAYPWGIDGLPEGVDYQLHVSLETHDVDSFVFAPSAVVEQELGNNTQVLDPTAGGADPGADFFTFYDPNVGKPGVIDFKTPYIRVSGTGDGSYDIFRFTATSTPAPLNPATGSVQEPVGKTYYTSVEYTLTGPAGPGAWKLGIGYRDYESNAAFLLDVANDLADQITAAVTAGLIDSHYVASVTSVGGVKLSIVNSAGFVLEGRTSTLSGLVHEISPAGSVTRTTTAQYENPVGTFNDIEFKSADVTLTTSTANETWQLQLVIGGTLRSHSVIGSTDETVIANAFETWLATLSGITVTPDSDNIIEIGAGASTFTLKVSTSGNNPEGQATIRGTPAGAVGSSFTAEGSNTNWTTVTLTLGGTPHQGERWHFAVGAATIHRDVLWNDTLSTIATALRALSGTGFTVTGTGTNLIVSFTGGGSGKVDFSIDQAAASGSVTVAASAMVSVDLSSLHGIHGGYGTHWKLDLTDAASTPATISYEVDSLDSLNATAGAMKDLVNGATLTTGYTAAYDSATQTLVISRVASKGTLASATVTESFTAGTASDTVAGGSNTNAAIDLTALSDAAGVASAWTITLPDVASAISVAFDTDRNTTAANFLDAIQASNALYSGSTYSSNTLTIKRSSAWAASPASLVLTVTETRPNKTATTSTVTSAYELTLGGSPVAGQTWTVTLPGGTGSGTWTVATDHAPSLADGLIALLASIKSKLANKALDLNGKILLWGTSSAPAGTIAELAVAGSATATGTLAAAWSMVITPDTSAGIHQSDVWTLVLDASLGGTTLRTFSAGAGDTDVLDFLVSKINGLGISGLTASKDGTTVVVTRTGGALAQIGNLKLAPHIGGTVSPVDTRPHYSELVIDLVADINVTTSPVIGGQDFQVVLNGRTYTYTVPTNTPDYNLNLATVAAGMVQAIHTAANSLFDAELVSGSTTKIRIFDRATTGAPQAGTDTFTFAGQRGGNAKVVADIDKSRLVSGSFDYLTGYIPVVHHYESVVDHYDPYQIFGITLWYYPVYRLDPVYVWQPVYEKVNWVASLRLELIDPLDPLHPLATSKYTPGDTAIDAGSQTVYDPFLFMDVPLSGSKDYEVRVSSVITYDKFLPQYVVPGVYRGLAYELVLSVSGHAINQNALDLSGKTLQFVEGAGAGAAGQITRYDPLTKAYYLNVGAGANFDTWSAMPGLTSLYDISSRLSDAVAPGQPAYATNYLNSAPVTDQWGVVLTRKPTDNVVINIDPAATRTYNADQAFNPDAAFGENTAKQVRAATDRALIQLGGTPAAGEYWVVTLTRTNTKLSVDSFQDAVFRALADGSLSAQELIDLRATNSDVFVYSGGSGDLATVATALATAIHGYGNYRATMTPGTGGAGPQILVTDSVGNAFYAELAIGILTTTASGTKVLRAADGQGAIQIARQQATNAFTSVAVELKGNVTAGEVWTLKLWDMVTDPTGASATYVRYTTKFGDTLSDIAAELGGQLGAATYDVIVRGRVITIGNALSTGTLDINAQVIVGLASTGETNGLRTGGTSVITPQLEFTTTNWNAPRTVTVMAIDDKVVDGNDALVFPAFDERVNAIRGPLSVVGGALVGAERFLTNPFRLPEETNDPQADGTVGSVGVDSNGNGVMTDEQASHFNALYGERPGFDPRMNQYPYEFTWLDGPALKKYLDVLSVSKEIFSVGSDKPFTVNLSITDATSGSAYALGSYVRFSGTPDQAAVNLASALKWREAVISLGGVAAEGEDWTLRLDLNLDGDSLDATDLNLTYHVPADGRALSKIVRDWAVALNAMPSPVAGYVFTAEADVDILGNAKLRLSIKTSGGATVAFGVAVDVGANGNRTVSGTPHQNFATIAGIGWTVAAFEVLGVPANSTWTLSMDDVLGPAPVETVSYTAATNAIDRLTFNLADRVSTKYLPVVSGQQVTFAASWPSTATSTLVLSGTPVAGTTWTVSLDIAGNVKSFSHLVTVSDTLETIGQALADAVSADATGALAARTAGVALIIVNTAGNTLSTSFAIGPAATPVTPDPVPTYVRDVELSGTPVAGDTWSVALTFNDGSGPVTTTHSYVVRATVALSEVAAGLAAKINAADTGFSAYVQGNTLVVENAGEPGFASAAKVTAAGAASGSITRSVASSTVTRLSLGGVATAGENWAVTVGGVTYSYVVESVEVIAAKLAAAVGTAANAAFVATSEGGTLILVNRVDGFTVTTGFTPAAVSTGTATLDATAATAWAVELAGRPVAGETWTIRLGGFDYSIIAGAGDTRPGLARKLAAAFNAAAPAGFVAAADDTSVVIANLLGASFGVTAGVTPVAGSATGGLEGTMTALAATSRSTMLGGTPVAGEIWSAGITVGAAAATAEYVVKLVDADANPATAKLPQTLGEVAAGLAAAINVAAQDGITALASGVRLVVVERNGVAFTAGFPILPAGALRVATANPTARVATLPAALTVGQTLSATLVGNDLSTVITYTVVASGDHAETAESAAAGLARAINVLQRRANTRPLSDGAALVVVNRAGHRFHPCQALCHRYRRGRRRRHGQCFAADAARGAGGGRRLGHPPRLRRRVAYGGARRRRRRVDPGHRRRAVAGRHGRHRQRHHRDCRGCRNHHRSSQRGRFRGQLRHAGCLLRRRRGERQRGYAARHAGAGRSLEAGRRRGRLHGHGSPGRKPAANRNAPGRRRQCRYVGPGRQVCRRRRRRATGGGQSRGRGLQHEFCHRAHLRGYRGCHQRDAQRGHPGRRAGQRCERDAGHRFRCRSHVQGLQRGRRFPDRCPGRGRPRGADRPAGGLRRDLGGRTGHHHQRRRNILYGRQLCGDQRVPGGDDQGRLWRSGPGRRNLDPDGGRRGEDAAD
jgi:hypothetical protein